VMHSDKRLVMWCCGCRCLLAACLCCTAVMTYLAMADVDREGDCCGLVVVLQLLVEYCRAGVTESAGCGDVIDVPHFARGNAMLAAIVVDR